MRALNLLSLWLLIVLLAPNLWASDYSRKELQDFLEKTINDEQVRQSKLQVIPDDDEILELYSNDRTNPEKKYEKTELYWDRKGDKHFGPALMTRHRGINILQLHGTRQEVAYQQGALLKDQLESTAYAYYKGRIDRGIEHSPVVKKFPMLEGLIKFFVNIYVNAPLHRRLTRDDRRTLKNFAKAGGVSTTDVMNIVVLPDAAQWLVANSYADFSIMDGFFGAIPGLGCSSFYVPRIKGIDGPMFARNLDYEGAGHYDKNAAVIYTYPDEESGDLAFANFATLGNPLGVVTGLNEAGLMLSLHLLTVDDVSRYGRPILSVTEEIMRRAHSLEEAVQIITSVRKYGGTWRIIVASRDEDEALMVDVSRDEKFITPLSIYGYGATNTALSSSMRKKEFSSSYNYYADSQYRHLNLKEELKQRRSLYIQDAIDVISSLRHYSPSKKSWARRSSHKTVSRINNVQSVLMVPDNGIAYTGKSTFDYATPAKGEYVPIPINLSEISDHRSLLAELEKMPSNMIKTEPVSSRVVLAHSNYRRAAQLVNEYQNHREAISLILEAAALEPNEILYPLVAGFAYFSYAAETNSLKRFDNRLEKGYNLLIQAEKLNPSEYQRQLIKLFKARYFAITGKKEDAEDETDGITDKFSKTLYNAARHLMFYGYQRNQLRNIEIDFNNGDISSF